MTLRVHVQATGGVVMTAVLRDGRTYRVAGERVFRAQEIATELQKVLTWDLRQHEARVEQWRRFFESLPESERAALDALEDEIPYDLLPESPE